jgi:hypothetical protein
LSFLNSDEILLRLVNLGEQTNLKLNKFTQNSFKIDELGLSLEYQDIVESFANGIILK